MRIANIIGLVILSACVEEIPIATDLQSSIAIEDVLIVEATLTDELKEQEILLSRGTSFSSDAPVIFEQGAQVNVIDAMGNTYDFEERESGAYRSTEPFAVQQNVDYQLLITVANGTEYRSETSRISGTSIIDDIYAERMISDNEVEGMAIFVDSSNPGGELNDYRYIYEETYKIIAPNWRAFEFEIISEGGVVLNEDTMEFEQIFPDVTLVPRAQEEQVCFNTVASNEIILSDGLTVRGNQIAGNQVRFINRSNPILSHRYSILVKQFLQTAEAAKFYRTLLQFSQSESLFSEVQPGFLEGNIEEVDNSEGLVIGFFNVASVTERRLFFNYADFFPGEELPPYFDGLNCNNPFSPPLGNPDRDGPTSPQDCGAPRPLLDYLAFEEIEFFESNTSPPPVCQGPYLVTPRPCGDCTALGTNVQPEFWIE